MYAPLFFQEGEYAMKKSKIIALASAVSLTAAAVFAATSMVFAAPALGDVDSNGKVTAKDARMILRHSAKIENLSDSVIPVADADGNGKVSATDARLVLRFASKLISTMGGEDKYAEFIKSNESSDTTATTKKTDSSDLSTRPVTRPTTKPADEPSTKPTTEPSTEPTTEPSTEPSTEPTTEPTTAPTTEPTTAPTTEPTTEPTTAKPDDNNNLPAAIRSFTSGKFDFTGTVISSSRKQDVRFTVDGKNLRIGMTVDGLNLDIMKLTEKNSITKKDVSKYYIISEDKKSYIEFNKAFMKMAGIDEANMELPALSVDLSGTECTVDTADFNGKENLTRYTFKSESSLIKFYLDGENLIGMETCDLSGNTLTMMVFDSFSGEIPAGKLSLNGYKKMSLTDFIALFGSVR